MGISPTRAEARLAGTLKAVSLISDLERRIHSLVEEQDQRQIQMVDLDNQIKGRKDTLIPEKIDAPPNPENAEILNQIAGLEQMKLSLAAMYGQTSTIINMLGTDLQTLLATYPHAEQAAEQQRNALARKQAAYPRLLIRHLYKCKRHGWADARMATLVEHKANLVLKRQEQGEAQAVEQETA